MKLLKLSLFVVLSVVIVFGQTVGDNTAVGHIAHWAWDGSDTTIAVNSVRGLVAGTDVDKYSSQNLLYQIIPKFNIFKLNVAYI